MIPSEHRTTFRGYHNKAVGECTECEAQIDLLQSDCLGFCDIPEEESYGSTLPYAMMYQCPQCGEVYWCHAGDDFYVIFRGFKGVSEQSFAADKKGAPRLVAN